MNEGSGSLGDQRGDPGDPDRQGGRDGVDDPSGLEDDPRPDTYELGTDGVAVVVVGYDGSPASLDALAWAAGSARRSGGRLVVAFVVPPVPPMSAATPVAYAATAVQLERAQDVVAEVADELRDYGVGWELVVTHGEVAEELERVADSFRADVMVVGRSMGIHVLSGSVPRRLLHRAHRPLLVVP